MATKLLDKVKMQEEQEDKEKKNSATVKSEEENTTRKRRALNKISSKDGSKDKQISAKINSNVYALFTEINKAQGLSNNSALNMIVTKYVRENKGILDEN